MQKCYETFFETIIAMSTFLRMLLLSSSFSFFALELFAQVLGEASSDDIRERPREISFRSIEVGITPYAALQPLSDNTARLPFVITRATLSALARLDNTMLYIDYSVGNIPDFPDAVTMVSGGAKFDFDFFLVPPTNDALRPLICFTSVADIVSATTPPSPQTTNVNNLSLATIGIGAGLGIAYQSKQWVSQAKAEGFIAIASQGFSPVVGFGSGLIGDIAVQFPYLLDKVGLAFSYRFRTSATRFANNTQFSYSFLSHTITAGITF
jgi:hypothetical protein